MKFQLWLLTDELVKGIKIKLEMFPVKGIILRFSTFRHGTLFYGNRNKLKNAKIRIDLTKKRYKIFTDAIDFVKAYKNVDCIMVDINCWLKVFFKNGRSNFFDISDLKSLFVEENSKCYDFLEHRVLVFVFENICFYY